MYYFCESLVISARPPPNSNRYAACLPVCLCQMTFVPQDDILFEELTVEDNILFAAILFNKVECSVRFLRDEKIGLVGVRLVVKWDS